MGTTTPEDDDIIRLEGIFFTQIRLTSIISYINKVGLLIFSHFWTTHFIVWTPPFGWTPRLNYTVLHSSVRWENPTQTHCWQVRSCCQWVAVELASSRIIKRPLCDWPLTFLPEYRHVSETTEGQYFHQIGMTFRSGRMSQDGTDEQTDGQTDGEHHCVTRPRLEGGSHFYSATQSYNFRGADARSLWMLLKTMLGETRLEDCNRVAASTTVLDTARRSSTHQVRTNENYASCAKSVMTNGSGVCDEHDFC